MNDTHALVHFHRVSVPTEHILCVTRPDFVLARVVARVSARPCGAARDHAEAELGESVESLLQEVVFEIIAGSVSLRRPVRVSALVQGVSEHLFGEGRLPAHGDARHAPELGVALNVPPDGVRAPVANGDVARLSDFRRRRVRHAECGERARRVPCGHRGTVRLIRVALIAALLTHRVFLRHFRTQAPAQLAQLKKLGLPLQTLLLREVIRQHQVQVPQVIEDVAEQETVPVQEEAPFAISRQILRGGLAEHAP